MTPTIAQLRPWPFMSPLVKQEEPQDVPEKAGPFCECIHWLTMEEIDRGKCASCGKALL